MIREKHTTTKKYFKLISRGALFFSYLFLTILYPNQLNNFFVTQIFFVKTYHLMWFVVVLVLLSKLFVAPKKEISSGKIFSEYYQATKISKDTKDTLKKISEKSNKQAIKSAFFWTLIVSIFLFAYFHFKLIDLWIYGFTLFAIFLDAIAINVWCPFRNWFFKNKCCNSCRIFNWGYWMVFLPLIVIPSFWSYSIIFLSLMIFVKWEYSHHKHPERFYEISNANLQCKNCNHPSGNCKKNTQKKIEGI